MKKRRLKRVHKGSQPTSLRNIVTVRLEAIVGVYSKLLASCWQNALPRILAREGKIARAFSRRCEIFAL